MLSKEDSKKKFHTEGENYRDSEVQTFVNFGFDPCRLLLQWWNRRSLECDETGHESNVAGMILWSAG